MHKQLRTCISCRVIKPQNELIRLTLDKDNKVIVDKKGKMGGRGAYVCNITCLEQAIKSGAVSRAFRRKVRVENF